MVDPFDLPVTEGVPLDECCKCAEPDVAISVYIKPHTYPFCHECEPRGQLLQTGKEQNWPYLRIEGITGTYALDSDWEAYFLTAICGTNERVIELLDALDELKAQQQIA